MEVPRQIDKGDGAAGANQVVPELVETLEVEPAVLVETLPDLVRRVLDGLLSSTEPIGCLCRKVVRLGVTG